MVLILFNLAINPTSKQSSVIDIRDSICQGISEQRPMSVDENFAEHQILGESQRSANSIKKTADDEFNESDAEDDADDVQFVSASGKTHANDVFNLSKNSTQIRRSSVIVNRYQRPCLNENIHSNDANEISGIQKANATEQSVGIVDLTLDEE